MQNRDGNFRINYKKRKTIISSITSSVESVLYITWKINI